MSKRLLCIVVVVLTVSSVTFGSFVGGQVNGSLRMGGFTTGTSVNIGSTGYPMSGAYGSQAANTQGWNGGGVVLQGQGAAGLQGRTYSSQGQYLAGGQAQGLANAGTGSAAMAQFGMASQSQGHYSWAGSAVQSQTIGGGQIGTATGTNIGAFGAAGAAGGASTFQYQTY